MRFTRNYCKDCHPSENEDEDESEEEEEEEEMDEEEGEEGEDTVDYKEASNANTNAWIKKKMIINYT